VGRPKEKVSDKVDFKQVAILCHLGFTDKKLADFFGVAERTINNWKKDSEFLALLKEAKELADKEVEKSLWERANGYSHEAVKIFMPAGAKEPIYAPYIEHYPPDPTSMIFWLKNRQPDKWREHRDETGNDLTKENLDALRELAKRVYERSF